MMRQFGGRGENRSRRGGPGSAPRRRAATNPEPTVPATERGATTIDALFGPLPPTVSTARVWLYDGQRITPADIRLGITDGSYSELLRGEIEAGTQLVTGITTPNDGQPRASGGAPSSPLIPQLPFRRRR